MKTLKEVRGARMRHGLARLRADDGLVAHDGENALSNKREKKHAPGKLFAEATLPVHRRR